MLINNGMSQNHLSNGQKPVLQNNKTNKNTNSMSFKGLAGLGVTTNNLFSLIQTHEIAGPVLVNTFSMVLPRTFIDFSRSPEAGIETGRRETTSLVSSSLLPGFYALGAGALYSKFNNPLKVSGTIPVNNSVMEHLHSAWKDTLKENITDESKRIDKYVYNALKGTEKFVNGNAEAIADGDVKKASTLISDYIKENLENKTSKNSFKKTTWNVVDILKTEQSINVNSVEMSVGQFIKSSNDVMVEVINKYEPKQLKDVFEKLSEVCTKRTVAGLGIAATIALSTQYINRYLTKRKTGSDAFVGLPNYNELTEKKSDNKLRSSGFIAAKLASVGTMCYLLGATITEKLRPDRMIESIARDPQKYLSKLQFKGNFPSLNQLRILSTITYSGRMLAASDENELRETNIRDMFGYLNWLVFGGFVTKLAGHAMSDGELCIEKEKFKGGGWLKKLLHIIQHSNLMTEHEIKANNSIRKAKKLIIQRNMAIGAGIAYSTAVLGFGIPHLNKFLTNKIVSKKINKQNFNKDKAIVKNTFEEFNKNSLLHHVEFSLLREQNKKIYYDKFLRHQQKYAGN